MFSLDADTVFRKIYTLKLEIQEIILNLYSVGPFFEEKSSEKNQWSPHHEIW